MDKAVTIGGIVWFVVVAAGCLGVVGLAIWVLSIIADGFKH